MGLRLRAMREDADKTQQEIAELLLMHRGVYARYENEVRSCPIDVIIRLVEYYDCTTDYLLGISSVKGHFSRK